MLNRTLITNDGNTIQSINGTANELLCIINDFSDYVCLTNNGVFRKKDRGNTNAKVALASAEFSPSSFKHVLRLASNGSVNLLSEHTSIADRVGVYWGMNVLNPAPPQVVGASLVGNALSWTSGGGLSAGYLVAVNTNASPATASEGRTLYVGTNTNFTLFDFSDFVPGVINHIVVAAINSDGVESQVTLIEYPVAPLQVTGQTIDQANQQVTLSWSSLPGKTYRVEKSLELTDWQPLTEIPPGNAAISTAAHFPAAECNMTRTFSDPGMTTKGFYRVKTPP